jgi:hypothetical protein
MFKTLIEIKDIKNTTDQRHSNVKKNKLTEDIVAAVATAVEYGRRQTFFFFNFLWPQAWSLNPLPEVFTL